MMKRLGKFKLIVRSYINGALVSEYDYPNRVIYEQDGKFYHNDLKDKKDCHRISNNEFVSEYRYSQIVTTSAAGVIQGILGILANGQEKEQEHPAPQGSSEHQEHSR